MRKLNYLPLMMVLAVAFTACGKKNDAASNNNNNGTSSTGSSSYTQGGFTSADFSQSCFQNRGALVTVNGQTACKYTIYRSYNGQLNPGQSVDLNSLENGYGYGSGTATGGSGTVYGGNYGGNYGGYPSNTGPIFDRVRIYDKVRVTSSNGPRVVVAGQDLGQVAADVSMQSNAEGAMIVSNVTSSGSGFNWSWNLPLIKTVEVTRCLGSDLRTTYNNCP